MNELATSSHVFLQLSARSQTPRPEPALWKLQPHRCTPPVHQCSGTSAKSTCGCSCIRVGDHRLEARLPRHRLLPKFLAHGIGTQRKTRFDIRHPSCFFAHQGQEPETCETHGNKTVSDKVLTPRGLRDSWVNIGSRGSWKTYPFCIVFTSACLTHDWKLTGQ